MSPSVPRVARRGRALAPAAGLVALLVALPGARALQAQAAADATSARADSIAVVEAARAAQASFERRRTALLPISHGGGRCEVQIGRWCYWYDEHDPRVPDEPPAIAAARDRLLAALRQAAGRTPGDAWVVGQHVRYLVEAGRASDAVVAAGACAADRAWCDALLGYALHAAGDAGEAERAFDAALAAMPPDAACRWLDPRPLVPPEDQGALGPPCAPGDTLVARFWRLATPFLVRDGNDRRNEHLARHVLARLFAHARTPYAARWTDDVEEMTLRYGWPDRWTRRPPPAHATTAVDAVGHEPWPSYRFTPDVAALDDPRGSAPPALGDRQAHERAAPPAARRIHELPLAVGGFQRGESLLVVAVAPPPPDSALAAYAAATLVVAALDGGSTAAVPVPLAPAKLVATAVAAATPSLVGVEAIGDSARALRARGYVEPPAADGGFAVSDLLLFDPDPAGAVPGSLDEALRTAVPDRLAAGGSVGVFWELYGLGDGANAVETAIHVESAPPGWLSRAIARVRGHPRAEPPRLRWTDVGAGGTVAPRAMLVELTGIDAGRHVVRLTVRHPDGRMAAASRTLIVGDRR